jgi:hypothetical protein
VKRHAQADVPVAILWRVQGSARRAAKALADDPTPAANATLGSLLRGSGGIRHRLARVGSVPSKCEKRRLPGIDERLVRAISRLNLVGCELLDPRNESMARIMDTRTFAPYSFFHSFVIRVTTRV